MITVALLLLVEVTALSMIIAPFNDISNRELIYKVLLPYNFTTPLNYWLTFTHHAIGAILYAAVAITTDAMIAGFMLQVCSQLNLLEYRITKLPSYILKARKQNKSENIIQKLEKLLIKRTVQHHVQIIRLVKQIILPYSQFLSSLLIEYANLLINKCI
jgi:hypothetical protein